MSEYAKQVRVNVTSVEFKGGGSMNKPPVLSDEKICEAMLLGMDTDTTVGQMMSDGFLSQHHRQIAQAQRDADVKFYEPVMKFVEKVKGKAYEAQAVMRQNGFVIDNLEDRWQKLCFTFYTDIAALSSEAEQILEYLEEK